MQPSFRTTKVLDLLLHRDNPRHVSKHNQQEVIEYLLADEEVYNLARHMSQNGINPLEVVAVFPDEDRNLIVAEGNRRVCAAQLLTDPQKAPESLRARFKALAAKGQDVSSINTAVFSDYDTAQPWLQVLHDGEQEGVGRRRWKPDQKARATTSKSTDALAVAVLDYAEKNGLISSEIRKAVQVSTATRYLANPDVRKSMGIASAATSGTIDIVGGKERFNKSVVDLVDGIRSRKLHSRSVTKDWLEYASSLDEKLGAASGPTTSVGDEEKPQKSQIKAGSKSAKVKIISPEIKYITQSSDLISVLNSVNSFKLSSLYKSLISINLEDHPALMTTAAWVFLETLTALNGRVGGDFVSYINNKMGSFGIPKDQIRDCKLSLEYISSHGNAQKHSAKFTAIDARNLHSHFQVLDPVLVALAQGCLNSTSNSK